MLKWPSTSGTFLGLTFLLKSSIVDVCRGLWNLISGNVARLSSDTKDCRPRFVGLGRVRFRGEREPLTTLATAGVRPV